MRSFRNFVNFICKYSESLSAFICILVSCHAPQQPRIMPRSSLFIVEIQRFSGVLTGKPCPRTYFSLDLAYILVLVGTAGAAGMAPPTSTRRKRVQEHSSAVSLCF